MARLVAKRARHPATTRVEFFHVEPFDSPQRRYGVGGAEQRLLLAVTVEQDLPLARSKRKVRHRLAVRDERVDHPGCLGDHLGVGSEAKVAVFINQGEQATRLDPEDRDPLPGGLDQSRNIPGGKLPAQVEQPLRDRRSTAARQPGELDPITARFEDLDRRPPTSGVLYVVKQSSIRITLPRVPARGSGVCFRNQRRRWFASKSGKVRRRSIPATFSSSQRNIGFWIVAFASGAVAEPIGLSRWI